MSERVATKPQKTLSRPNTTATPGLLQRKCACGSGGSAGLTGACDDCGRKRLLGLQTKLEVSHPGDSFEQEADRVADEVMRQPAPAPSQNLSAAGGGVQRKTITPRGSSASAAGAISAPSIVEDTLNSPGQPLDPSTRSFMEARFGHDFGRVRVHTDARAAESAEAVRAKAYTVGHDMVFRRGAYAPNTGEGRRLLAHELAHVVQQGSWMDTAPGIGREHMSQEAVGRGAARGGSLKINGASGLRIAREPEGAAAPAAPLGPTVTAEIEERLIQELQKARVSLPPSANIPQEANRTFATAAIIKPDRTVTYVTAHFAEGMTAHAEPQLLKKIEGIVNSGDTVAIAIDQVPCDHTRANCQAILKQFRENPQRGSLRVYTVRALRKGLPETVTPQTATPGQRVSPKTAIQRPIESRFLFEEREFRRVRLPLLKEPPAPPPAAPAAPAAAQAKPPAPTTAAAVEPPAGAATPSAGAEPGAGVSKPSSGAKVNPPSGTAPAPSSGGAKPRVNVGRIALGLGKFAGPLVLDMLNRYTMGKAEAARAQTMIVEKIDSAEVKARITELAEQKRLEIARMQYRGREVFATVFLRLSFTNDVLNSMTLSRIEIGDVNKTSFMSSVMSHDGLTMAENKMWWVDTSLPLPNVEVSQSEEAQIKLEMMEEEAHKPMTMDPDALGELSEERNRLLGEVPKIKQKEEKEKQEEIGRPSVIPDQKKRAQQQAEIGDQLRRLNEKKQASAPKKDDAPKPAPPALSPAVAPAAAPQPSLLPGAPGEDPIAQAAQVVKQAEVWATQLVSKGTALANRILTDNAPTQTERNAFRDEEAQWRLSVKYAMNAFTEKSRSEAVNALGELINRFGGKLDELRIRLVG